MLALLGLCGCVVPFWVPFEQLSNVVPLFFRHQTDRRLFGFLLPAAWLQAARRRRLLPLVDGRGERLGNPQPPGSHWLKPWRLSWAW